MKNQNTTIVRRCAALLGLVLLGANCVLAENEPADDTATGASTLNLGTNGSPVVGSGNIDNSDEDWYKITNTGTGDSIYDFIVITFQFSGSGPDTCRLRVLGPNSEIEIFNELTDGNFQRTFTISNPAKNAAYLIGCLGNSADGNKPYTLTVGPSPNLDLIEEIAETEEEIEALMRQNESASSKMIKVIAKLKTAKTNAKKKKVKKILKKIKQRKRARQIEILGLENLLEDLESMLNPL